MKMKWNDLRRYEEVSVAIRLDDVSEKNKRVELWCFEVKNKTSQRDQPYMKMTAGLSCQNNNFIDLSYQQSIEFRTFQLYTTYLISEE